MVFATSLIGQCIQVGDTLMEIMSFDPIDDEYSMLPAWRDDNAIYASSSISRAAAWSLYYAQR